MLSIKKDELYFLFAITLLVLISSNIPQVIGKITSPSDRYFLPIPICNSADTVSHLTWVKQGEKCNILFKNKYTTEEQKRIIFHPLFLFLGKISKIFDLSPGEIFITARILSTLFLLFIIYVFISLITYDKFIRKITFALVCFSSGIGAYLVVFGIFYPAKDIVEANYPLDLWIPEGITFFGIYVSPLITFSLSLMILIFLLYLLFLRNKNYIFLIFAGLLNCILGLIHPYDIFITTSIIVFYSIYLRKIIPAFIFIILTSPVVSYHLFCIICNPIFKTWLSSPRLSPTLLSILYGYGFFIPIFLVALIKKKVQHNFLLIWIVTTAVIIFLPLPFQRRLIQGFHIPLCVICAPIIFEYCKKYFNNYKKAIRIFIILSSFSNISILVSDVKEYYLRIEFPYYIEKEIIDGFNFLDKKIKEDKNVLPLFGVDEVVLPSYSLGNLIPAFSGASVYFGHYDLTNNIQEKITKTKAFLEGDTKEKYKFLKDNKIEYIFISTDYYKKTFDFQFLDEVYRNDKVVIYKFK